MPFDLLLLFSTNMQVEAIADSAGLRRITFKIHVPSPTRDEYLEIFRRACERRGLAYDAGHQGAKYPAFILT